MEEIKKSLEQKTEVKNDPEGIYRQLPDLLPTIKEKPEQNVSSSETNIQGDGNISIIGGHDLNINISNTDPNKNKTDPNENKTDPNKSIFVIAFFGLLFVLFGLLFVLFVNSGKYYFVNESLKNVPTSANNANANSVLNIQQDRNSSNENKIKNDLKSNAHIQKPTYGGNYSSKNGKDGQKPTPPSNSKPDPNKNTSLSDNTLYD